MTCSTGYGYLGLAGIDQGGNHATAAVFYAISKFGTLLAFNEYAATDESASTTAYNLKMIPPPGMELSWFCDPAMRARQYATTDMASPMDRYIEAGIPLQASPESGDNAIDTLRKLLEVREQFVGNAPARASMCSTAAKCSSRCSRQSSGAT